MITSVQDWLNLLGNAHGATGIPLIVGGVALMLFGWRLWRLSVVLAFGVVGMGVTGVLVGPGEDQLFYAILGGVALAALSYWPATYSVAVLGGAIGGFVAHYYLCQLRAEGLMLWGGAGATFFACTAVALINRRHVVILVTAFLGAVLVMSGLMTWVMTMPTLSGALQSMSSGSMIVVPFLLLVPTVMSCFYQMAEVRRLQAEL